MRLSSPLAGFALAAAALVAGCSSGETLAAAEQEVAAFHRDLAAGRVEQIYAEAAPELRAATPRQTFVRFLTGVRSKLGPLRSRSRSGFNVNYGTGGTQTTLVYASEFAKGAATETFVYKHSGEAARLAGYHVNSDALIMN